MSLTGYGGFGGVHGTPHGSGKNGWPSTSDYEGIGGRVLEIDEAFIGYTGIPADTGGVLGVGGSVDKGGAGAGGGGYVGGSAAWDSIAGGGGGYSFVITDYEKSGIDIDCPLPSYYRIKYRDAFDDGQILNLSNGQYWKGLESYYGTTGKYKFADGNQEQPNPLTFTGSSTMIGNDGNGFVRIKKIDDLS